MKRYFILCLMAILAACSSSGPKYESIYSDETNKYQIKPAKSYYSPLYMDPVTGIYKENRSTGKKVKMTKFVDAYSYFQIYEKALKKGTQSTYGVPSKLDDWNAYSGSSVPDAPYHDIFLTGYDRDGNVVGEVDIEDGSHYKVDLWDYFQFIPKHARYVKFKVRSYYKIADPKPLIKTESLVKTRYENRYVDTYFTTIPVPPIFSAVYYSETDGFNKMRLSYEDLNKRYQENPALFFKNNEGDIRKVGGYTFSNIENDWHDLRRVHEKIGNEPLFDLAVARKQFLNALRDGDFPKYSQLMALKLAEIESVMGQELDPVLAREKELFDLEGRILKVSSGSKFIKLVADAAQCQFITSEIDLFNKKRVFKSPPCVSKECHKKYGDWMNKSWDFRSKICKRVDSVKKNYLFSEIHREITGEHLWDYKKRALYYSLYFDKLDKSQHLVYEELKARYPQYDIDWESYGKKDKKEFFDRRRSEMAEAKRAREKRRAESLANTFRQAASYAQSKWGNAGSDDHMKTFSETGNQFNKQAVQSFKILTDQEEAKRLEIVRQVQLQNHNKPKYMYMGGGPYTREQISELHKKRMADELLEAKRHCAEVGGKFDEKSRICNNLKVPKGPHIPVAMGSTGSGLQNSRSDPSNNQTTQKPHKSGLESTSNSHVVAAVNNARLSKENTESVNNTEARNKKHFMPLQESMVLCWEVGQKKGKWICVGKSSKNTIPVEDLSSAIKYADYSCQVDKLHPAVITPPKGVNNVKRSGYVSCGIPLNAYSTDVVALYGAGSVVAGARRTYHCHEGKTITPNNMKNLCK